jgi:hypothetical protein
MPVPRRRSGSAAGSFTSLPKLALKLLDADFIFQKSKTLIYYGFAPAVVLMGMMTEPRPASWLELINILE